MSRGLLASTLVVFGLLIAGRLVAYGDDADSPPQRAARPTAAGPEPLSEPRSKRALEIPSCDGAFVPEREFLRAGWRRRSVRIGPLRVLNPGGLAEPGRAGRRIWKVPILIPPAREITIELGAFTARRVAFVEFGTQKWNGYASELHPVVRLSDCPRLPPELGRLPAGQHYVFPAFVLVRRGSCVPLTVTRNGNRSHRRVISFGAGDCGDRDQTR